MEDINKLESNDEFLSDTPRDPICFGDFKIVYDLACIIFVSLLDYDSFCTVRQVNKSWNKLLVTIGKNKYDNDKKSFKFKDVLLLQYKIILNNSYISTLMLASSMCIKPKCDICQDDIAFRSKFDIYIDWCCNRMGLLYVHIPKYTDRKGNIDCECYKWFTETIKLFYDRTTDVEDGLKIIRSDNLEMLLRNLLSKNTSIYYMATRHRSNNTHSDRRLKNAYDGMGVDLSFLWLYLFYDRMILESRK